MPLSHPLSAADRVVLIMPPVGGLLDGFASGLVALAAYLRQHARSTSVEIVDLSAERECDLPTAVADLHLASGTIVGITTTTASYQAAISVARAVRGAAPRALIVLGGHHAGPTARVVLARHGPYVDVVVEGEGERPLLSLVRGHVNPHEIQGLWFHDGTEIVHTGNPVPLSTEELDATPYDIEFDKMLCAPGKFDHFTYVSARGCPLSCSFCSVANQQIRARSPGRVGEDIAAIVAAGYRRLAIEDNFFAHAPARTREVCEELTRVRSRLGVEFSWDCQTRVESLARPETIPLLARASCDAVYIGVESFNEEHLKFLGKTPNADRYLHLLREVVVPRLLDHRLGCYVNLQFGIPGETMAHHRRTEQVLSELGRLAARRGTAITIFPMLFVVYPGTSHFLSGVASGRWPADAFEAFTAWEHDVQPVLRWLGDRFAHGTGGIPEGVLNASDAFKTFSFDSERVLAVENHLKTLSRIDGVRLFDYSRHLRTAGAATSANPRVATLRQAQA